MRRPRPLVSALLAATVLAVLPGTPAAAMARGFAPVDRPGPPLDVSRAQLDASLTCTPNVTRGHESVLFVPGTTVNPASYSWSWFPALNHLGRPYCAVTLPHDTTGDMQIAAEYVVHAIRTIHQRTGRKVQVLGHSQGGALPRLALRFWPDLRAMVDDYIAFAGTNHGTVIAGPMCSAGCAPAIWQQATDSNLMQALNSGQETFAGISYTQIYTHLDQVVQPNLDERGSTSVHGPGDITNVATQDVCPANTADHVAVGTYDPVAYALALDALDHPGPADPRRIDRSVCTQLVMPGVDTGSLPTHLAQFWQQIMTALLTQPRVDAEPALQPYTKADH